MQRILKAFMLSAFFYASNAVLAACPLAPVAAEVVQARVIDGDTLALEDGRRVRFSAINTPEVAYKNKPGQAFGNEAKNALQDMLAEGGAKILPGANQQDKYGRGLFHVFDEQGKSIEERLILQGLAFHVAIPPNITMVECLAAAEQVARAAKQGVWASPYWQPLQATADLRGGFALVEGRIEKVTKSRRATYIDFEGNLTLRVDDAEQQYFAASWWQMLPKHRWIAKGWIIDRKNIKPPFKRWMIRLGHPSMLIKVD